MGSDDAQLREITWDISARRCDQDRRRTHSFRDAMYHSSMGEHLSGQQAAIARRVLRLSAGVTANRTAKSMRNDRDRPDRADPVRRH
jgi:hypothetical protein